MGSSQDNKSSKKLDASASSSNNTAINSNNATMIGELIDIYQYGMDIPKNPERALYWSEMELEDSDLVDGSIET